MRRSRVLVIDDDPDFSYVVSALAQRDGLYCTVLPDGRAAQKAIQTEEPPDLVVLDQFLPFCDGYTLLLAMRDSPLWREVPVIIVSQKPSPKDEVTAFNYGATDYVAKPVHPQAFLARMHRRIAARD